MYSILYIILFNVIEQHTSQFWHMTIHYELSTLMIWLLFLPDIILLCYIIRLIISLNINNAFMQTLLNIIVYIGYIWIIVISFLWLDTIISIFYDASSLITNATNIKQVNIIISTSGIVIPISFSNLTSNWIEAILKNYHDNIDLLITIKLVLYEENIIYLLIFIVGILIILIISTILTRNK